MGRYKLVIIFCLLFMTPANDLNAQDPHVRFRDSRDREWWLDWQVGKSFIHPLYLPFYLIELLASGDADPGYQFQTVSLNLYLREGDDWVVKKKGIARRYGRLSDLKEGNDGSLYFLFGKGFIMPRPLTLVRIGPDMSVKKYPLIFSGWFELDELSMEVLPDGRKYIFYTKYIDTEENDRATGIFCQVLDKNISLKKPCLIKYDYDSIEFMRTWLKEDKIIVEWWIEDNVFYQEKLLKPKGQVELDINGPVCEIK